MSQPANVAGPTQPSVELMLEPQPAVESGSSEPVLTESIRETESAAIQAGASLEESPGVLDSVFGPSGLFAFGIGLLALIFLRRTIKRSKQRMKSDDLDTPKERIAELRRESLASREPLERTIAEANDIARALASMLDVKAARIEALIADADERLARLAAASDASVEPTPTKAGPPSEAAGAPPAEAQVPRPAPSSPEPAGDTQAARVSRLATEGLSPAEIAERLGLRVGQVQLMLALGPAG